jgi:hypothetical protein
MRRCDETADQGAARHHRRCQIQNVRLRVRHCEFQFGDRVAEGKTIQEAAKIKNTDIVQELNLPPVKIHCSVLAEDAIKSALADYKQKNHVATETEATLRVADEAADSVEAPQH